MFKLSFRLWIFLIIFSGNFLLLLWQYQYFDNIITDTELEYRSDFTIKRTWFCLLLQNYSLIQVDEKISYINIKQKGQKEAKDIH